MFYDRTRKEVTFGIKINWSSKTGDFLKEDQFI